MKDTVSLQSVYTASKVCCDRLLGHSLGCKALCGGMDHVSCVTFD